MYSWRDNSFESLLSIESEHELFEQVARLGLEMGFEYCAYGIQMPVPISRPSVAMFSNYSREWQECYTTRGYLRVDPTVRHALQSTLPIVWSHDVFKTVPQMWEEARAHGLKYGYAQASHDSRGAVGLLTLARSADQLTDGELLANQARMVWLAQFTHAGMSRLLVPKLAPETLVKMTAREREVLRWTAEGKTAYEISQIINVSERTVNFHINNVVSKMGASNKTQAAVKAMALGMLF